MKYCIVKNSGVNWNQYWEKDPKITGVDVSHSAASTYIGRQLSLFHRYGDIVEVTRDCGRMNVYNPIGDYSVCHVI